MELHCREGAHQAPVSELGPQQSKGLTPQLCQKNGIPGKNGELARSCVTRFAQQAVVQDEILLVTKCPHSQGSGCWGASWDGARTGGHLGQLLHNNSENHRLFRTARFIMPKWSCYGIPRQLSHCHGLDLSLTHISFGFSERGQTFFSPIMCRSSLIEWEGRRINLKYISTIF